MSETLDAYRVAQEPYYRPVADEVDAVMTAHNVPTVKPDYLRQMAAAFEAIADGSADYVATDGAREYDFGDFSILTPEPASDVASTAGEDTE